MIQVISVSHMVSDEVVVNSKSLVLSNELINVELPS